MKDFESVIYGFMEIFDSLEIFKKLYPDRKGRGMFQLGTLGSDLLKITGNLHDAVFDVEVLEKLCYFEMASKY